MKEQMDLAASQIRASELAEEDVREITRRVWQRVEDGSAETVEAAQVETIRGCDDYQRLIPAFVNGSLSPSRALLLEDHARQCVPCRRALSGARSGGAASGGRSAANDRSRRAPRTRWLAAAAVAVVALGSGLLLWRSGSALPYGAIVESTGAGLYRAASLEPVAVGDELAVGERLRSGPGESSFLRLADGSRVEVRGRSELSVEARRGTTVRVERGDVIVEAAPQGAGRLFVSTADCLVSVKGTIFAVSRGTRGSQVAVIEGEVQVDHAGREEVLYAGDRTATYAGFSHGRFDEAFEWSRNVDSYLALLKEVTELRQALARDLPRPELRYSSRLLDLAPDGMAFYVALPNFAETVSEANRIVQERVAQSPVLNEWWASRQSAEARTHLATVSALLAEVGGYLGDEIVVAAAAGPESGSSGNPMKEGPLVLAELVDAASMRQFVEGLGVGHEGAEGVVFLDEDSLLEEGTAARGGSGLVMWLGDDTLIAAPDAAVVRAAVARMESTSRPVPEGFKRHLADAYAEGAEILVGADLHALMEVAGRDIGEEREALDQLGLLDASHLILQQRRVGERTQSDAVLAFDGPRRGLAAALAAPAPMGSLAYVSPDAKVAAAAILTSPAELFDRMLALAARDSEAVAELQRIEAELGVDLRDDVAAALGGELAVALDGPLLPEPAWKVVAEVYDPDKLVWALQQLLAAANDERAARGEEPIEWLEEEVGGRLYHRVAGDRTFEMTFDEGYLVAGSNRGVIERAIRFRQSGYSLTTSARFSRLLPAGSQPNFSALFYQDALELLKPLADRIATGGLTDEQAAAIEELRQSTEPTLAYAIGEDDRIVFAVDGVADLLAAGIPALLGFGDLGAFGVALDDAETGASTSVEARAGQGGTLARPAA